MIIQNQIQSIKKRVSENIHNMPGWRTNRKIVVIESDDWGSIRMSSSEAFNDFQKHGFPVNRCAFNTYDSLECNEDLEQLFDVLNSVKDKNDNCAIMTLNNIVANPDFRRIKESDFTQYYFEPFTKTLEAYPHHNNVYALYKAGIKEKLISIQFHGREHVNVRRWMCALHHGDKTALLAFKHNMFSVHTGISSSCKSEYLDAFGFENSTEIADSSTIIGEGLGIFRELWGYSSESFIATCYIWHTDMEKYLKNNGVMYMQSGLYQLQPYKTGYQKIRHYTGQNDNGLSYIVRNVHFEPATDPNRDWIGDCMKSIQTAFVWHKPAVISTHRLNFVGYLNSKNRQINLMKFKCLLNMITKKWPDVEFMTSDQVCALMPL